MRGRSVLAITDHSVSLGVAGGLSVDDLEEQWKEIDEVRHELGREFTLLKGTEVEIRADGTLDYSDEVLEKFDIVVASLHSSLRQPRERVTQRIINAIRNPNVDVIGHPTGRMIPDREGADLDMEAVIKAAAEHKVALEINAHPARLDLDDIYSRRAVELGVLLSINTDAHSAEDMDLVHFGIATARRGWVEAEQVINTWNTERLQRWLKSRKR
jgi:DNA polymerase (family 10)